MSDADGWACIYQDSIKKCQSENVQVMTSDEALGYSMDNPQFDTIFRKMQSLLVQAVFLPPNISRPRGFIRGVSLRALLFPFCLLDSQLTPSPLSL